jgi:hypothetical protein
MGMIRWLFDGVLLRCSRGMKQLPAHQKFEAITITCNALLKKLRALRSRKT